MAKIDEFDMTRAQFAPEFHFGCISLGNADTLRLSVACFINSQSELTARLDGEDSHVAIRMFELPEGQVEFDRVIQHFAKEKKTRAKLPEGVPFEPSTLALAELPDGFVHEAFPRSGRDLVHVYRSESLGVLIRLTAKGQTMLRHPVLAHLHENLRLVPGQWVRDVPQMQPSDASTVQAFDEEIEESVRLELDDCVGRAKEALGLLSGTGPLETAEAIYRAIDALRDGKKLSKGQRNQIAMDYGALWGDALCQAAGWSWRAVRLDPDDAESVVYAVCNEAHTHAVDPIYTIDEILTDKSAANNTLLLFNLILAGSLPPAVVGDYTWLN